MRSKQVGLALVWGVLVVAMCGSATAQPAPDPVLARVDGSDIHLSDITDAAAALPQEYRGMPEAALVGLLTDQLIDRAAVVAMARRNGLDKEAVTKRAIAHAVDEALENAQMRRAIEPAITEDKLRARYAAETSDRAGELEVHARHILVASEADGLTVITELKAGADFATIAKARSSDRGGEGGGDLGFFKKGDMVPEFADAAFALEPGATSPQPVKSQFGWHVIRVEERRTAPPPSFEASQDDLRKAVIQEGVKTVLAQARAAAKIERFNMDGTVRKATDDAEPPKP